MDTTKHPPIGAQALWHRSRQGSRPVLVIKRLSARVRVLDLVEGDARHLIFRDVAPGNLTAVRS